MLWTVQIESALGSDPFVSPYFRGVFACDKLPRSISYPSAVVANTDPADKPGQHWVAFLFNERGEGEYFDSYGLPPINSPLFKFLTRNSVRIKCNPIQLQGFTSDVCGQYCIAFLASRCRGETMRDVIEKYKGKVPGEKDRVMANMVNKHYHITKIQRGRGFDQCCCAKIECREHNHLKCVEKQCKKRCK